MRVYRNRNFKSVSLQKMSWFAQENPGQSQLSQLNFSKIHLSILKCLDFYYNYMDT
jgi:hypothetical protein